MKRITALAIVAVAGLAAGCGTQAGYLVSPPRVQRVAAVNTAEVAGSITLTRGPKTVILYSGVHIVVPSSDISRVDTPISAKTLWVPVIRVPTIDGAHLALRGTATILVPALWKGPGGASWQHWPITVTLPLDLPIPARTRDGGEISLAMKVQSVVIRGSSIAGSRQVLVLARPLAGQERWQDVTANRHPASRQAIASQRVGVWLPFSPRAGGAMGFRTQSSVWSAARLGLRFKVQSRYNLLIHSAGPENILLYDRHSDGSRWYVQKFRSLAWLP